MSMQCIAGGGGEAEVGVLSQPADQQWAVDNSVLLWIVYKTKGSSIIFLKIPFNHPVKVYRV